MNKKQAGPSLASMRLAVQVVPGAKRSAVVGMHGDAVKIRLQAQPVEGKANEALIRLIADALGLPKTAVQVSHGHTAKRKLVEITTNTLTLEVVRQALIGMVDKQ